MIGRKWLHPDNRPDGKKMTRVLAIGLLTTVFLSGCQHSKPDYVQLISPADLNQLLQKQDVFLVDVHTPEQKHIKGTDLFIPYNEVERYQGKFPKDKATPIYLYCMSGPMANEAARSLHKIGYTNLNNLEGGTMAWARLGLPFQ
jgi:rhodanese-related sulfurtransferase